MINKGKEKEKEKRSKHQFDNISCRREVSLFKVQRNQNGSVLAKLHLYIIEPYQNLNTKISSK